MTMYPQGDSGGALMAQDRQLLGWSAVGIVSYQPGIECGTDNYVVFTEIRSESELGAEAELKIYNLGAPPPLRQGFRNFLNHYFI